MASSHRAIAAASRPSLSSAFAMTRRSSAPKGPRSPSLVSSSSRIAWIFRSNIPPHRGAPFESRQKRSFFGIGEIVQVLTNPGETLKSLTDARRALEEARQEIKENKERSQLRQTHTFAPFPNFFPRNAEMRMLTRILEGPPAFTVLMGSSSVGKTALLREVLGGDGRDKYHTMHFDLRIPGFADLEGLYGSLSKQMEWYFGVLAHEEGYEDFEREAWAFKHDRLSVERAIERDGSGSVKTSDIARLMELFQSSLLRYWEHDPEKDKDDGSESTEDTKVGHAQSLHEKAKSSETPRAAEKAPVVPNAHNERAKRVPVIFFDEAHKLPALIRSPEAMKCLLDAMLVLTKQDRLCHVIHSTSDSFYQTWLRQMNVMQHCKVICIGDCSREELKAYFEERLLPGVPDHLRKGLDFEELYHVFGGKLVHIADYVTDFVNANGKFAIEKSSHFLQAHTLLHITLLHASEAELDALETEQQKDRLDRGLRISRRISRAPRVPAAGFKIYSSLDPTSDPVSAMQSDGEGGRPPAYTAMQLLDVIHRVTSVSRGRVESLGMPALAPVKYFALCREIGVRAVDDMVRARLLELRWVDCVQPDRQNLSQTQRQMWDSQGADYAEGDIEPIDEGQLGLEEEAPGPVVLPVSPVMGYAMRVVLAEYEYDAIVGEHDQDADGIVRDDAESDRRTERGGSRGVYRGSTTSDDKSDYVSLSDVEEY